MLKTGEINMQNQNKLRTAFLSFEDFHGRKDIGSSRIRAKWLVERWKDAGEDLGDAELFMHGRKYDVIVYQKVYWWQHAEKFNGIKILDICDPDFLHWGYPVKRMIQLCDAITVSTEKLAIAISNFAGDKPVYIIPDCVLDPHLLPKKVHQGPLKKVAWFGYPENFPMLDAAVAALLKRNLELIVVSSKPYAPKTTMGSKRLELTNYPWSEHWQDDLLRADAVLNPKSDKGRFAYKSDNKTVQSWALGLPVAHIDKDLDAIKTEESRAAEGAYRRKKVEETRDVREAVRMLKEVIAKVSPANPA